MKVLCFMPILLLWSQVRVINADAQLLVFEPSQNVNWEVVGELVRAFVEEKEAVTVFDVDESFDFTDYDFDDGIIQMIQAIAAVKICEGISDEIVSKFHDMGSELNLPSTTKSYFALSSSVNILHDDLHYFATINPNGRWIFMLVNVDHTDVENFLIKAWIKYKMANILILLSEHNSTTYVKSYNPFGLKDGHYGTFWTSEINSENLRAIQEKVGGIFTEKITNLNKYPLKAAFYADNFVHNRLLEEEMVKVFAKTLNSRFVYIESASTSVLGKRLPNGTLTGQLKAVEDDEVDIAMNIRVVCPSSTNNVAFLNPISVSKLQYMVKRRPDEPHLLHFIVSQSFDNYTRIVFAIASVIFIAFWYFIERIRLGFTGEARMDFFKICLYVVGIQSTVSMPLGKIKNQRRILVGSMLIVSLIMCSAFQGMIVGLMGEIIDSQIDTLEELLSNDYNFTAFTSYTDIFKPNKHGSNVNSIQRRIYGRQYVETVLALENFQKVISRPKQAVLIRSEYAADIKMTYYDNKTGEDLYHIVKESPISVYASYIVPKTSPLISILNSAVVRAGEFGFQRFIQMKVDAAYERMLSRRFKTIFSGGTDSRVITLSITRDIFAFYAVGIGIAIIAFLTEIATGYYRRKHLKINLKSSEMPNHQFIH